MSISSAIGTQRMLNNMIEEILIIAVAFFADLAHNQILLWQCLVLELEL